MKKTVIFISLASLTALVSCKKTETDTPIRKQDPVFTASILPTKTSIDTSNGKVSWEGDEEITITDAANVSVVYKVASVSEGKATFTKKEGETGSLGAGPYTAVFGPSSLDAQVYSATAGNLPMTASSATTTLTFSVTCGLMEVTLTKAGESISSVAVSDGTHTYVLNCDVSQDIESGKAFYVALPAGDYNKFIFTNARGGVCVKTAKIGKEVAIAANDIQPISFSKLSFTYIVHNASELYDAIDASQSGDKIMLASGTYTATKTFAITKNITLEGGYGANPVIGDVPAPATVKAVLDGDGKYQVMSITVPVVDGQSIVLSGIAIQNGLNNSTNGAGLFMNQGTAVLNYVDIMNNNGNKMGIGFTVTGTSSHITFRNCRIQGNTTTGNGANYVTGGAAVSIDNCVFSGNSSGMGGGLYVYNNNAKSVSIQVFDSEFYNNAATGYGGAICLRGDGATSGVTLNIANSTLYGNTSGTWGSAIAVYGKTGGCTATANVFSCTITGNTASGSHGALVRYNNYTTVNVYNSIITGNTCTTATDKADVSGTMTSINNVVGGTSTDYLASSASSQSGSITKAFKVKTDATTAGMKVATLKGYYSGGDTAFENALGYDQWGTERTGTIVGACVTLDE